MPCVTLTSLFFSPNPQLCFISKPVVVVVLIDSGGNADQICLSGLAWMFSLCLCPHYSVCFQECLQCLLRGNEELAMVGGSQELIFFASLIFHSPFSLCVSVWMETESIWGSHAYAGSDFF